MRKPIYECTLPFPPSVNSAYGQRSNKRRFKSKQLKEWLEKSPDLIPSKEYGMITFPVRIEYKFFFPDRRKRDVTNYIKVPEDYLVYHCVIEDDNNTIATETHAIFGGHDKGNPRVEVSIYEA